MTSDKSDVQKSSSESGTTGGSPPKPHGPFGHDLLRILNILVRILVRLGAILGGLMAGRAVARRRQRRSD
jgi:hypothetical protein